MRTTNHRQIIAQSLENAVERAVFESLPDATKADILNLLKAGESPAKIEAGVISSIQKKAPAMPPNEVDRIGAKYFLAATYALKNNLHKKA